MGVPVNKLQNLENISLNEKMRRTIENKGRFVDMKVWIYESLKIILP